MNSVFQVIVTEEAMANTTTLPGPTWSDREEISVVIPCLNEAKSIASNIDKALAAFRESGLNGEVVVADNGSTDGSIEIAAQHGARVVHAGLEGYEFIVGNRFRGDIKDGAMSWHHRRIGTPVLSALLNLFFGAGVGDINCGMRGITKDLARRLDFRTTGMEFASESLIKAAKVGARLTEVPITMWPDTRDSAPHLRTFRDGWRH